MARLFFEHPSRDPGGDLRAYLDQFEGGPGAAAEYRPPVDVIETRDAIEVIADLPGITADALRIVMSNGRLIIAGRKEAFACQHRGAAFHLAERTFGRFAFAIRLTAAVDAGRGRARLTAGELHIVLPRIDDRRGQEIAIAIDPA